MKKKMSKSVVHKALVNFSRREWRMVERAAAVERLPVATLLRVVAVETCERTVRDGRRPFILDRLEFRRAVEAGAENAIALVLERAVRRAVKESAASTLELVGRAGVDRAAAIVRALPDGG